MPKRLSAPSTNSLVDTWGRCNRKLADKICPHCGKQFRPPSKRSRYCSRPCMWANNGKHQKRQPEVWWLNARGYIEGRITDAERRTRRVKQHRFLMEQHLMRPLLPSEDVHHINGIKTDNDISNLELLTHGEHTTEHNQQRTYRRGYKLNLSPEERAARAARLRQVRNSGRG